MNSRKILFRCPLGSTGLMTLTWLPNLRNAPVRLGGSWTNEVLNSGSVDEIKFAAELAQGFSGAIRVEVEARSNRTQSRWALLPSRFCLLKITSSALGGKRNTVVRVATYDSLQSPWRGGPSPSSSTGRKIEWVITPRGPLLRAIKALYGVGAETFEEILQTAKLCRSPNCGRRPRRHRR